MGYQAYSNVIYGFEIENDFLESVEPVRGCFHKVDESKPFCPECGSPMFKQESQSVLDYLVGDGNKTQLSYFKESGDCSRNPNYKYMIGFKLGETDYNNDRANVSLPTPTMQQEILDFIKEHNLPVGADELKMIVYTYHSY